MRSFRKVAALATAESFGRGASWLTLFALPWLLTADEYGIVALINSFEGVAVGFLLLGQDRAVLWRYAGRDTATAGRATVGTAILVTTAACVAGLALGLTVAWSTGGSLVGVPVWPHLVVLGLAVVLVNVNRIALAFARIARWTGEFVLNRVVVGATKLVVVLGLGAASGSSLAYPVGIVTANGLGGMRLWRRILPRGWIRQSWGPEARTLLRYGTPLSVHLLAMSTTRFVDRWIIGALLGLAAVGSYSWYYMFGSAVVFLYAALTVYYEPEIYREQRAEGTDRRALQEYLGASFVVAGVYGLAGSLLVAVVGNALVPGSVRADPAIIRIVLVAHWLHPVYHVCNYLLSSIGRTLPIAAISGVTVVVATIASLAFVPTLGVVGGAWATLVGALCLAGAAMFVVARVGIQVKLSRPLLIVGVLGTLVITTSDLWTLAAASAALSLYGLGEIRTIPSGGRGS